MSEWKEYRIKDICLRIGSGTTPKSTNEKFYEAGQHYWVNTGDLNNGVVSDCRQKITDLALKDCSALHFYPEGTVIEAMYGATIGKVGLLKMKATVNQACCAMVINKKRALPKFVLNYLINYKPLLIKESFGGTQPNVNQTKVATIIITLPSLIEQQRIVDYLDEKTKAIDARISVLEKKSDAYTRLKASVINRAVTRGLNPNVPLKDSGIEWIGMIPEHWEVKRFKDLFKNYTTGVTPPSKDDSFFDIENGYTWVTIADLNNKMILESNLNLTQKAVDKYTPEITKKGSLMFSFKLSIGKLAFADKDLYTNEAIVSIPSQKGICLDHAYYYLPLVLDKNATENIYGAKMLNQKIIANMLMAVPPYSEQQSIATYLDTKSSEIDKAIDNLGKQIEALKRLKRSLINEVVTGKRKV